MTERPVRIATLGAAFSANKGAASMLDALVHGAPSTLGACSFDVLTTYPSDDAVVVGDRPVTLVSLTPKQLALVAFPIGLVAGALRRLRLPYRWLLRTPALRALADADVVVDVAGISYADKRGFPTLVYNVLMTGLPLLLGRPTVKASQAVGPFTERPVRWAAKVVLPRLDAICARGRITRSHLDGLGLVNVHDAADLALSLEEFADLPAHLAETVGGSPRPIVVMPSAVVNRLCERRGIDYVSAMGSVIAELRNRTGRRVVIAPHSYRPGQKAGRMNDVPVCRAIADTSSADPDVVLVTDDLQPAQLRRLIASADLLVTSRFHAMVGALTTTTPMVVIGWSHKYAEVLEPFDLDVALPYDALTDPAAVADRCGAALDAADVTRAAIDRALPAARVASRRNFEIIRDVVDRSRA